LRQYGLQPLCNVADPATLRSPDGCIGTDTYAIGMPQPPDAFQVIVSIRAHRGIAWISVTFARGTLTTFIESVSDEILHGIARVEEFEEVAGALDKELVAVVTADKVGWKLAYPYIDPEFPEKLTAAISNLRTRERHARDLH